MEIRAAHEGEADALAAIQQAAAVAALPHVFPPELYPFPTESVRERWAEALGDPGVSVLVAAEGGRPVGFAGVRLEASGEAWLDGLYVVPSLWRRGVGGLLHDTALERAENLAAARAHLWVLERNDSARRFYERRGWRENGRTRVVPYPPNLTDLGYTQPLSVAG